MRQATQLALDIRLPSTATLANFNFTNQLALKNAINNFLLGNHEEVYYLWGVSGVGKSHLLQACTREMTERGLPATYLNLHAQDQLNPTISESLEKLALVSIDNLECVLGNEDWESAIFHLYNRMLAKNRLLLLSATVPPIKLPIKLLDLHSRLKASLIFKLTELNDNQKHDVLISRANKLGLMMSQQVADFILNHYSRNLNDLINYLQTLDQASLAEQRRLTIPFVKSVLS